MHRDPLPSEQFRYEGLDPLDERTLHARREGVFLVLSGIFLGSLAMLNILGITRFIKLLEVDFDESRPGTTVFAVAVGVLPYPITFLCTDFIGELYGRRRASRVVWTGFLLNLWVVLILWIGGVLPGFEAQDPQLQQSVAAAVQAVEDPEARKAIASAVERPPVFFEVRRLAFGAVVASMIAYLVAQLVDVYAFHFWRGLTRGRHLWLRSNGSTLVSQLVDTTAVILITHYFAAALPVDEDRDLAGQLLAFIATGYLFKAFMAMIDTFPFMLGAPALARYLRLPPPTHIPETSGRAAVEAGVG